MPLLIGEYESTVDAKHRLAIASALRDQIDLQTDGPDYILVLGPDRHLWLYPDRYYRRLLATLRRSPLPDRRTRKIDLLFAMARPLKCDGQGRVVLPEKSMQRAVVGEQVILAGVLDHIEIWPTDEWERHVQDSLPTYGDVLYEAAESVPAEPDVPPTA